MESKRLQILTQYLTISLEAAGLRVVEDTEVITLVDSCNNFIKLSFLYMLYMECHFWLVREKSVLSFYKHGALIIIKRLETLCHFIHSMEEVTQLNPLPVVLYVLSFLPLDEDIW